MSVNAFIADDGAALPLHGWMPEGKPRAVILAIHGFNDYSRFFSQPAAFFNRHGIACYAYDQRGFGLAPQRGHWAGTGTYVSDLKQLIALLRQRHSETPFYLLGSSMGGAVTIVAMSEPGAPTVDGVILEAPAVWGRVAMPWYQRLLLWSSAHTLPWLELTGEGLHISPSDNIEMLRALGRDPVVIKKTRVDAIYGLSNLMDAALASAPRLKAPTLLLYGKHDQVIPAQPMLDFARHLPQLGEAQRFAWYSEGYHMLLRDLHAERVWQDILTWIETPDAPLPSGADIQAREALAQTASAS